MGQSPLCHQLSNMLRRGSVLHARSLLLYRYGRRSENNGGKQETAASEQQTESSDPKAPRRGRNWITDMYDKVNLSVDTLNYIALGLLIFIFAVIFIASRH